MLKKFITAALVFFATWAQAGQPAFKDVVAQYQAAEGSRVVTSPMAEPDGQHYNLQGVLDVVEGRREAVARFDFGGFPLAMQRTLNPDLTGFDYFAVVISDKARAAYLKHARKGVGFSAIGRYVENRNFTTASGALKTMPVFEVVHWEPWGATAVRP